MNEKRKSEGELVRSVFSDEKSQAQKLLEKCKADERKRNHFGIPFGKGTIYFVPAGTNVDEWKDRKNRILAKFRKMC